MASSVKSGKSCVYVMGDCEEHAMSKALRTCLVLSDAQPTLVMATVLPVPQRSVEQFTEASSALCKCDVCSSGLRNHISNLSEIYV